MSLMSDVGASVGECQATLLKKLDCACRLFFLRLHASTSMKFPWLGSYEDHSGTSIQFGLSKPLVDAILNGIIRQQLIYKRLRASQSLKSSRCCLSNVDGTHCSLISKIAFRLAGAHGTNEGKHEKEMAGRNSASPIFSLGCGARR